MLLVLLVSCVPTLEPRHRTATDSAGDPAHLTDTGRQSTPAHHPPSLRINEVQASNDATFMSEPGHFPDWIELFNAGTETLDLTEFILRESGNGGQQLRGFLAPGEHALFTSDDLGFNLSRDGEQLELALQDHVVDRVATGLLPTDISLARFPDGGDWLPTARPTPGWTNGSRPSSSLDTSAYLFDDATLHALQLTVPDESLTALRIDRTTKVPAALQVRNVWFPEVAVRLKGQIGSRRELDEKAAWKIDLNEYEGHSFAGQTTLTVNNMVQDPTYMAEHLAYTIYRAAGIPAPRTSWCQLTINNEYWGLYALIETIDERFLARWFTDPSGRMWEGKYGQDFVDGDLAALDFDSGPSDDRSTLEAVARVLSGAATNAAIAELEQLLDLDQWLTNMAVESLILHWDGYTTANNYRIYEDPVSGRLFILPWGTDQTFRDLRYGPYEGRGDVFEFCLENPACAERYDQSLREVADLVDSLALEETLDRQLARLQTHIEEDPRREFRLERHARTVTRMREVIRDWPDTVRDGLPDR